MREADFITYLKKTGRSTNTINRYVNSVKDFALFLVDHCGRSSIEDTSTDDLHSYGEYLKVHSPKKAYLRLWGIDHYFRFNGNKSLSMLANALKWVVHHNPLNLDKILGIKKEHSAKLKALGLEHVRHMLERGATKANRTKLAEESEVPIDVILELVMISDLSRIPGLAEMRTRLYYDSGLDTLDKIASLDPEEMREFLIDWIAKNDFEGSASTPPEARFTVEMAKFLDRVVEF